MESTTKNEINNFDDFLKDNGDDLEGIIQNEPHKNKYETVRYYKMNQFPYYLIGKVVSKFEIDGINKFLNGVGILIGPRVALTVAHNLCHMTPNKSILQTKKVCFFPSANGDFNPFEPVKSVKIYIPDAYLNAIKTDDKDAQLVNDWGLIYLASPIGDSISSILDIEKRPEMKVDENKELYSFFTNNSKLNIDTLVNQTKSGKISIVGYTEFKERYKNNNAYKFLNNFKKKTSLNEKAEPGQNMNQKKKFLSEIVKDGEKEKEININISITEDVNEGLITSSRYYNGNPNPPAGQSNELEYIVFGDETYSKDFDITDADKQIMSESKGKLVFNEEDQVKNALKYQISTYKGQSGSPIFLRYKRISNSKKGEYVYQFLGLHSRRGPSVNQNNFYESEKMSALTENLLTTEDQRISRSREQMGQKMGAFNPSKQLGIDSSNFEKPKIVLKGEEGKLGKADTETKQKPNEIISINGACDYNLAVCVLGETIPMISSLVHSGLAEVPPDNTVARSEYIYTKLLLNDTVQFTGLFKRQTALSVLFSFASQILNTPKEYVLLQDVENHGLTILNYNFEKDKKLCEVLDDQEISNSIALEVNLNIKKYGEYLADQILSKYLENFDIEENKLKQDFKKHMKGLFHSIFREIMGFKNIPLTYGKLFKKIRNMILTKLGLLDKAKNSG